MSDRSRFGRTKRGRRSSIRSLDAPPIGTGSFGNPSAGLAKITFDTGTFSTDLNDLTTGPLKIDTAARHLNTYFITYDIATLATPQTTLGVSISTATRIGLSGFNVPSNLHMPELSKFRTIIPSPQVMHVDKQYYFSNDTGSYPLPRLLAPVQPTDFSVTLDSTTGLPPSGVIVLDSEVMAYQSITANVLNTVSRCITTSCDPLNPPAHSTTTLLYTTQRRITSGRAIRRGTKISR